MEQRIERDLSRIEHDFNELALPFMQKHGQYFRYGNVTGLHGMRLSITLKAGREMLRWLWGAVAQWSERLQVKQEVLGSIPSDFFFSFSWLVLMQMVERSVVL